jgi:predicted O-methyltransferase YrrM
MVTLYHLKKFLMNRIYDFRILAFMENVYYLTALPFGWLTYCYSRLIKKPYFGVWMASAQGNPFRYRHMRDTVFAYVKGLGDRGESGNFVNVMEIGSYAGGSTIQWATALRESGASTYRVHSVDPWDAYIDESRNFRVAYRIMNRNLANGNVLRLFVQNLAAAGVADNCRQFRGRSEEVLSMLKADQFDIIYIDGDHASEAMKRDLSNAVPLLKTGGILCGDDLELQMDMLDETFVYANAESDFIMDPKSGTLFHPGVVIGMYEFFGRRVSNYNGFWIQKWDGREFHDVELPN